MPAPVIPWQPSNIPREIQAELERRKVNRGFKYVDNSKVGWDPENGDWKKYKGPMVSWIRMCSNSAGHPLNKKERFVLYGGKGFYQSYGFHRPADKPPGSRYQIIGYTPGDFENADFGEPHIIENSLTKPGDEPVNYPIHVPPPEISRLEVTIQKELFRRAQIEWVCFSWKQLVYMTPYFLVPGITCIVEWGWNHYNIQSLVDLGDKTKMRNLWDNAYPLYTDNILKSNGNYDVIYGIVTNFNWSIEGNKIICSTEITSKDRLYAGIAKDYGLTVKEGGKNEPGIIQSLKDFISKDDNAKTLRTIVMNPDVSGEQAQLVQGDPKKQVWIDILNPLLLQGPAEVIGMRRPYVFGLFSGRPVELNGKFGEPRAADFDKGVQDNNDTEKIWINMGMVVQILNHFSALESGGKQGKSMFEVDIQNSVIGGHPNMISCDPRVLVPNWRAPKFHWGAIGEMDASRSGKSQYEKQFRHPISFNKNDPKDKFQEVLGRQFYQGSSVCYRNNLDVIINFNRYRYVNLKNTAALANFSFPAYSDAMLPKTIRGLKENKVEANRSGLLSNIYISYALLRDAVVNTSNASYTEIYKNILQVLMDAVDGYWDLMLVEVDGVMTITDRKYIGKYALDKQQDKVYSFDYYDADSIIKSLKFKPFLSDAQATRVIYGEVNNKDSKYKYLDKNDLLDYVFRDAVVGTPEDKQQGDAQSSLAKRISAREQHKDLVRTVQTVNAKPNDPGLQMSLITEGGSDEKRNIVKLVLPNQQLLRLLLNDGDEENNARYCAVQPGIVLEMTIQGIGGLRTFQYFTVRNLPEPYSDRNIVFRITNIVQTVETGNWETTIQAQILPLRGYIKTRLKGPLPDGVPSDNGWPIDNTNGKK